MIRIRAFCCLRPTKPIPLDLCGGEQKEKGHRFGWPFVICKWRLELRVDSLQLTDFVDVLLHG